MTELDVVTAENRDGISVTLKANGEYKDAWIVFHGQDFAGLSDQIKAAQESGFFTVVADASVSYRAETNLAQGGVTTEPVNAPQAGSTPTPAASGAVTKTCPHGTKQYKTGSKNGRNWAAYFCPAPKGDPSQCAVEWA